MLEQVPPQSLDAEKSVIGSALLNAESMDETNGLRADQFYDDANEKIWAVLLRMRADGKPIDPVTVAEALSAAGNLEDVGGLEYIAELVRVVPHAAHADYYAELVRNEWAKRQIIYAAGDVLRRSYQKSDETAEEILGRALGDLAKVSESITPARDSSMGSLLLDLMRQIESGEIDPGVATGFVDLDDLIIGLPPGGLTVLAARPGVGKTSLAGNLAVNIAKRGTGVAFFSYEQRRLELVERLLASESAMDSHKIRANDLNEAERYYVIEAANKLERLPIAIDESMGRTVQQLASVLRRFRTKYGSDVAIIDYLQLVEADDRRVNREQQVAGITRQLKRLAQQENIPVVILAQLNRESEKQVRKPRLSDLRESGAIEQDADMVWFIDRPTPEQVADIDREDSSDGAVVYDTPDHPPPAKLYVEKNRNGRTGYVRLTWDAKCMTFRNAAESWRSAADSF